MAKEYPSVVPTNSSYDQPGNQNKTIEVDCPCVKLGVLAPDVPPCKRCKGTGKIKVLKRWEPRHCTGRRRFYKEAKKEIL